jgi:HSP20 family molecular chaperone IbpA
MNKKLLIFLSVLFGLVVGALATYGMIKSKPELIASKTPASSTASSGSKDEAFDDIYRREQDMMKSFDKLLDGNFFGQHGTFENMKQFRKDMEKHFGDVQGDHSFSTAPFDTWFSHRFGGGTLEDIQQREDSQFVYFDVKVNDLKSTSITTNVSGGYVTISGQIEKKSQDKDGASENVYQSLFRRVLPLPANVDASKMETTTQGDTVTLKFPKLST